MAAAEARRSGVRPGGAVGRSDLYFALFLVATLNAFAEPALRQIEAAGPARAAFNLLGISAILWVALAAGLKILADDRGETPRLRGDAAVAAIVIAAAAIPTPVASGVALAFAALWAIATAGAGSPLRRAAIIFLAVTGALVWGRLLLALLGRPLLDLDALFVSTLLGAARAGNMIWSQQAGMRIIVAPGCSSLQGISLALALWVTVNQYFKVRLDWRAVGYGLAALAVTMTVNVVRIAGLLNWPQHFEAIHTGWVSVLLMWAILLLVAGICVFGARREIFRQV